MPSYCVCVGEEGIWRRQCTCPVCIWRSEVRVGGFHLLLSTLFIESFLLTLEFTISGRMAGRQASMIHLPPPPSAGGWGAWGDLEMHVSLCAQLYVGARDPHSGLHDCPGSTLPSPQRPHLQFHTSHAGYSSLILLWSIIGVKMLQGIKKEAIKILGLKMAQQWKALGIRLMAPGPAWWKEGSARPSIHM